MGAGPGEIRQQHAGAGRVLQVLLQDLEQLSGWEFSFAKNHATRWPVEWAKNGTYYREEDGERIQIIGALTLPETMLEYMTDDCLRRYGHVGQICRLISLFCLQADFQRRPNVYPETIRVTLPEDSYLQWGWYHLNPIRSPRVPWRPPDRHSDPDSLGIEVIARYSEMNPMLLPAKTPVERQAHQELARQYELAIDTDLRLGDEDEALIVYRGREIRWINGGEHSAPSTRLEAMHRLILKA